MVCNSYTVSKSYKRRGVVVPFYCYSLLLLWNKGISFISIVRNHPFERWIICYIWFNTMHLLPFFLQVDTLFTVCMQCSLVFPSGRFPHYVCDNIQIQDHSHSLVLECFSTVETLKTQNFYRKCSWLIWQLFMSWKSISPMKLFIEKCTVYCDLL